MHELIFNDDFMEWVLIASVYFMLCAQGWRETAPDRMRRKRRDNRQWNLAACIITPVFVPIALPSMLTVAALRKAQDKLRTR